MPTSVGSLRNIQLQVFDKNDAEMGQQVRLQLARYAQECQDIKTFINEMPAVTVNIKTYAGSGAVTIYRTKSITVSRALKGGVSEIAESVLFELCNWYQGDFSTLQHNKAKGGEITPQQAGINIARCESKTIYMHGVFLQHLKSAGVPLSAYGEANRSEVQGKDLGRVEQQTMITAHDSKAAATDITSLVTPEMYWLQMIDGNYHPNDFHIPIQKRGIVGVVPPWLETCIEKVWGKLLTSNKSVFYTKLFELAKASGLEIKAGYELTHAMKVVAGAAAPIHGVEKSQIKGEVVGKLAGAPPDLEDKLKAVGLL